MSHVALLETERTLCNLSIAGKTGSGKSVLLNALFGEKLVYKGREKQARTNVGRPVTGDIVRYDLSPEHPLVIFDTPGWGTSKDANREIEQHVEGLIEHFGKRSPQERIHALWYCINARGQRIENREIDWMKELSREVPIILVVTQFFGRADEEFLSYLKGLELPVSAIVPVLAAPFEVTEDIALPARGLDILVKETAEVLPSEARLAFLQAQQVDSSLEELSFSHDY